MQQEHEPLDGDLAGEAFRRAVLRLFVRRDFIDVETAQGMLAWPRSGFHVQGVRTGSHRHRHCLSSSRLAMSAKASA